MHEMCKTCWGVGQVAMSETPGEHMCRACNGGGYVPGERVLAGSSSSGAGHPVAAFIFFVLLGLGFWFAAIQFPIFREPLLYAAMAIGGILAIWLALFALRVILMLIKSLLSLRVVQYTLAAAVVGIIAYGYIQYG